METKNKKVLIIEDETTLLQAIEKKLILEGYTAISAADGEEGLNKIKSEKPDMVLLDILMPKVNGIEVLKNLKNNPETSQIPVIIISNSGQPVEIAQILSLGADDYLVKADFTPEEVISKVRNLFIKINKEEPQEKGEKILIIEDDPILLEICSKKIKNEGFNVDIALDSESGLKKIMENKPDLILLDIILPGASGFDVLKKVKESPDASISKIPVIIISNLGQESDIKKAKELGAENYLIKASVTVNEIIEEVRKTLKRNSDG